MLMRKNVEEKKCWQYFLEMLKKMLATLPKNVDAKILITIPKNY
jgi:hypothetical protein